MSKLTRLQQLLYQTQAVTPSQFLQLLDQANIQDIDGYLLFTGQTGCKQWLENVDYLASSQTVSRELIEKWQTEGDFQFIGQTIDGDYLVATKVWVRVIPVSLYQSDIEKYQLNLADFFLRYLDGELPSQILSMP